MASATMKKPFRFTGTHMLACLIAFFGVIIAVNFTMATLASKSWTGLVVKNSYVESQKYNSVLADAARQAQRGWSSTLAYENGEFAFYLKDKDGSPVKLDTVVMSLGRPAFEQQDQKLDLVALANDRFGLPIKLADGTWMLRIDAMSAQGKYRRDLRLFVRDGVGTAQ